MQNPRESRRLQFTRVACGPTNVLLLNVALIKTARVYDQLDFEAVNVGITRAYQPQCCCANNRWMVGGMGEKTLMSHGLEQYSRPDTCVCVCRIDCWLRSWLITTCWKGDKKSSSPMNSNTHVDVGEENCNDLLALFNVPYHLITRGVDPAIPVLDPSNYLPWARCDWLPER